MSMARLLLALALALQLGACVNQTITTNEVPKVASATTTVPEGQLLDVGISILNPGIEDYEKGEQTYPEVRKAESRYMPFLLGLLRGPWGWSLFAVVWTAAALGVVAKLRNRLSDARWSTLLASRICSGAMYAGVPIVVPERVLPMPLSPSSSLARPKSATFGTTAPSSMCISTFAGLRSR